MVTLPSASFQLYAGFVLLFLIRDSGFPSRPRTPGRSNKSQQCKLTSLGPTTAGSSRAGKSILAPLQPDGISCTRTTHLTLLSAVILYFLTTAKRIQAISHRAVEFQGMLLTTSTTNGSECLGFVAWKGKDSFLQVWQHRGPQPSSLQSKEQEVAVSLGLPSRGRLGRQGSVCSSGMLMVYVSSAPGSSEFLTSVQPSTRVRFPLMLGMEGREALSR